MPKKQLLAVLESEWGPEWHSQFSYFSFEPIAAASIGQVHRATLNNGQDLAIKVQYPGVRESIDSDIDNVVGLIKMSRALPKHIDIDPLIQEAKAQLKTEADYLQEAKFLKTYKANLADHPDFIVPFVVDELTTENILAMEYINGDPINEFEANSEVAHVLCEKLMALTYIELFDNRLMQSDPNFANYLYQVDTQRVVLLDFGACRYLTEHTSAHYLMMAKAMQHQNTANMHKALMALGLIDSNMSENVVKTIIEACVIASECLQTSPYHLKQKQLIKRIQKATVPLISDKTSTVTPKFDVALVNRKITGMILLANKLEVSLDFKAAIASYLKPLAGNQQETDSTNE
jgi:predicted unusual protein kinase regulating ubiquinone biosynthesis (AarF/ABC1/UbiB family)